MYKGKHIVENDCSVTPRIFI